MEKSARWPRILGGYQHGCVHVCFQDARVTPDLKMLRACKTVPKWFDSLLTSWSNSVDLVSSLEALNFHSRRQMRQ